MNRILTGVLVLAIHTMASAASAQNAPRPAQVIVNNAPAGINIDIFLDAGKVQTVAVNQQGSTGFTLDFLSLGKPQGQVYIETCRDGVRIRVVSDGTNVGTDEGCERRPVGVPFTFTCTNKITINFAAARGSFAGCGPWYTNKIVLAGIAVTGGGIVIGTTGGGSSSAPVAAAPTIPINTIPVTPTNNTSTTPPTVVVPVPTVGNPNGTHVIATCAVGTDNGNHNVVLRFCDQVRQLVISASNGGMSVTASTLWVLVQGSYDTSTGRFHFTRSGALSGTSFNNVEFQFFGQIDSAGNIIGGEVQMGPGGMPGNQRITYNITTRKS